MDSIAVTIFLIFVGIIVFLSIREIMTWYWKIDTIIKNQETQIAIQKAMLEELKKKNYPVGSEVRL